MKVSLSLKFDVHLLCNFGLGNVISLTWIEKKTSPNLERRKKVEKQKTNRCNSNLLHFLIITT
jgi:hypothetical protein